MIGLVLLSVNLYDSVAILQLLAGLCLLFFYDDILRRVVVTADRRNCLDLFKKIENQIQDNFTTSDYNRFRRFLDCEYDGNGNFNSLRAYRNSVSYIGKLAFVFLFCLLFVAAHENTQVSKCEENSIVCYFWILLADAVFLIVSFWSLRYRFHRFLAGYWKFVWISLILMALNTLSLIISIPCLISDSICVYIIFASFFAVALMMILAFEYDERRTISICQDLTVLADGIELFAAWSLDPNNLMKYRRMSSPFRELFNHEASQIEAQKAVDKYVHKEFESILDKHKTVNFLFNSSIRRSYRFAISLLELLWSRKETIIISCVLILFFFCWIKLLSRIL